MFAALHHPSPPRMTVDEFLAWEPPTEGVGRWQLVDGEAVAMAPARFAHNSLQSELARLLGNHLLATGRHYIVATEPGVVPRVRADDNYRVPDLGVTCAPAVDHAHMPDPVLLVDILSPNHRALTRSNVWAYTTIPTVREILILQSTRIEAELLRRGADGAWPDRFAPLAKDAMLELECVGFSIPLAHVYRTTYLAA